MDNSTPSNSSLPTGVKTRKDIALKTRLQSFIKSRGLSEPEFFHKLEMSRQRWYYYSWGLWQFPDYLKIRVSMLLNIPVASIWPDSEKEEGKA